MQVAERDSAILSESTLRFLGATSRGQLIGGALIPAASGKTLEVIDPATELVISSIPAGDVNDVNAAVEAARSAFEDPSWASMGPHERATVLLRIADLIDANAEELAQLDSVDVGMPISVAPWIVSGAATTFRYYAGWVTKIFGHTNPSDPGTISFTLREPIGVCGLIIPWNGPLGSTAWKVAPALACGNTVVLKPAEQASLSVLRLAQLIQESDLLPSGVINVVTGVGEEAGVALVNHPGVDKISFTGSTAVGHSIVESSARDFKHVTLELGGKSPNIVFADADIEEAVASAVSAFCLLTGQICVAGSRLFIHEDVYDQVVDGVASFAANMQPGDPLDPTTAMGPLVSQEQWDRVTGYIATGREEGARVVRGGGDRDGAGYFVEPTVFADVQNDMRIAQEEIFGPVVAAIPFRDEDDVIRQANDTTYGLAACVWTRDVGRAHRVSRRLQAGTVWVNTFGLTDVIAPFGGYKSSGIGRELGPESIDAFTETKTVYIKL